MTPRPKKRKIALVTGGAGFIGSFLCEELLNLGHTVLAVDNLSTGSLNNIRHLKKNKKFFFEVGNIMDVKLMDELVSQSDIIFHLAAAVGVKLIIEKPVDTIQTNIVGTETVLKLANKYDKKVILASTSEVYGKNNKTPFKETDDSVYGPTIKSRWSYACSKAVDEFLALAYHHEKKLKVVIVRLFNTIGARQTGQYGMVVPTFVKQALMGHDITVYGDGKQSRCFSNVMDVVNAIIKLSDTKDAIGEVFNIGSQEEITIMQLAKQVKALCKSESNIKLISYDTAFARGFEDMQKRIPDISKIYKAIGYKPKIRLDETIHEIIEYYRK